MNRFFVKCPMCMRPLAVEHYNTSSSVQCAGCDTKLQVRAFPALYRTEDATGNGQAVMPDDVSCFYHPDKKASHVCDSCGRFLCDLCELPFNQEVLCAPCLERRRKQPSPTTVTARVMRYDKLVLMIAVLPLIYFPLTIFTSPVVLFAVPFFWRKQVEMSASKRIKMIVAFIFALLQVIGWIALAGVLIERIAHGN